MKEVYNLLKELKTLGAKISVEDKNLNIDINPDFLTLEIQDRIKFYKNDIIEFIDKSSATETIGQIPNVHTKNLNGLPLTNYPISDAQRRLWILSQFEDGSIAYNMPSVTNLRGDYDISCFKRAIESTIERHEILRTIFEEETDGVIKQKILTFKDLGFKIDYVDFRQEALKQEKINEYIQNNSKKKFNLSQGPLLRAALLQVDDQEFLFYSNMHHIISDGWSIEVLSKDILSFYDAYKANRKPNLEKLRIQYKDYSAWQLALLKQDSFVDHQNYWKEKLAGELPLLNLPSSKKRPSVKTHNGRTLFTYLNKELTEKLKNISIENDGTLFMGLVTSLKTLIYRYTGLEDIIIGTPIAGRIHPDLENQIGFYVNSLALRTTISSKDSFIELFRNVRETVLGAYVHQAYPFDALVDELGHTRLRNRSAIFDVLIVLQNAGEKINEQFLFSEQIDAINEIGFGTCIYDIKFEFQELGDYLSLTVEYNIDIYEAEIIEGFIRHFKEILKGVLANPSNSIESFDYLLKEEKEQLISNFNLIKASYPSSKTIIDLFQEQVNLQDKNVAVIFNDNYCSYEELDKRSNQVANFLNGEAKSKIEEKVGLLLNPGIDTIVAMLGILKAGGGYVPMDPNLPEDRLLFMASDVEIRILITSKEFIEKSNRLLWTLPSLERYLCIDSDDVKAETELHENTMMSNELWDHVGQTANDQITGGGWLSSYTGKVIPKNEMEEYSLNVYKKLKPKLNKSARVLEIGCSSGLTLVKVAPEVARYYGTDLSSVIIENTQKLVNDKNFTNVKLKQLPAHEILALEENNFDLIIINSVIQHFHGHNYLIKVIKACIDLLNANGQIFIGDVMDINMKEALIDDLETFKKLNQNNDFITKTDFSSDLFVAKGFFEDLKFDEMRITNVEISDKIRTIENELTKYRYDVILTIHKSEEGQINVNSEKDNQLSRNKYQNDKSDLNKFPNTLPKIKISPNNLAYIIYTSGTTGNPKGVMIEHYNVVRLFKTNPSLFNFDSNDVWTMFHSYAFDFSVWEIYGALLFGGKLVIIPKDIAQDAGLYLDLLEKEKVTVLNQTPSAFYNLSDIHEVRLHKLLKIRYVIFGGEALNPIMLKFWNKTYPACQLINMYGITETTVHTTYKEIDEEDILLNRSNIGKVIPTVSCYLLDEQKKLVPFGVSGELYIGGDGIARGYLNRDSLNAERFVANPFIPKERLYRTGDQAKYLPNRDLEYLGRLDNQVKIRGYRIELGEIEQALIKHPEINEVIVISRSNALGDNELVAYVISNSDQKTNELRQFLKNSLPDYMIPAHFVQMQSFPLTRNGKVNKKTLPDPIGLQINLGVTYVEPRNDLERKMVKIWQELLQRDKIGIEDDFFALGGHSLKAVRLSGEYHKILSVKLSLKELFGYPTIASQAILIGSLIKKSFVKIERVKDQDNYPISDAQRRLWILSQFENGSTAYNMPSSISLNENIDIDCFKLAVADVIERHEILRTVFKKDEQSGEISQWIRRMDEIKFEIDCIDYTQLNDKGLVSHEEIQEQKWNLIQAIAEKDALIAFDLENGPLLRATLFQLEKNEFIFYYNMHHIISDGWSLKVLNDDVLAFYNSRLNGTKIELNPLKIQYKDYASWQLEELKSENYNRHREYWLQSLQGELPYIDLPSLKQRPRLKTFQGQTLKTILNVESTQMIKTFAYQNNGTLFMGLLSTLNIALYHYTSSTDIIVGSPVAGREHADLFDQIGFYVNTLPLRNKIIPSESFTEMFQRVKKNTLEAYEHQMYPFDRLVREIDLERNISRNAIFDIMLVLQNNLEIDSDFVLEESPDTISNSGFSTSKFDLLINVEEYGENLVMSFEYNTDVYDQDIIESFIRHYKNIINNVLKSPANPISQIDYLSKDETYELLYKLNDTTKKYQPQTVIDLFENQVILTPNKVAIEFEDNLLTYDNLNQLANRVAHHLIQKLNASNCSRVGVMLERSIENVIAMLGVMKSGATYVPIDPNYPTDRINYICSDANIDTVISTNNLFKKHELDESKLLEIDKIEANELDKTNPPMRNQLEDGAFVIYTSGSTGKPKGIVQNHRMLSNLIQWDLKHSGIQPGLKYLQYASFSFDASLHDIFFTITSGGSAYIVNDALRVDLISLKEVIISKKIQVISMPYSALKAFFLLLNNENLENHSINYIVSTAEQLYVSQNIENFLIKNPTIELHNHYGPSETHVVTSHAISAKNKNIESRVSIGKPISNTQIYILNRSLKLVAKGVIGELYVGGENLATGYLNHESLNREKFIVNPFNNNELIYKTGDLGRWLPDGNIEFLGRIDDQVKIRGYRIELGEIEQTLLENKEIVQTVVTLWKNQNDEDEIVAYFTALSDLKINEIKSDLKKHLPDYMLPTYFVQLKEIPLTSNGKIDKKSLPNPKGNSIESGATFEPPKNDIETKLIELWQMVLAKENIGVNDDFFILGGYSFKALGLIVEYKNKFNVALTLQDIYDKPILREHAELIEVRQWIKDGVTSETLKDESVETFDF